jgi:hypothetical protein
LRRCRRRFLWKGQPLTSGRILEMGDREACEAFAACAIGQKDGLWVEYIFDMIENRTVLVPADLKEQVAGVMMQLELDRVFDGRKHLWLEYDLGQSMRGILKLIF